MENVRVRVHCGIGEAIVIERIKDEQVWECTNCEYQKESIILGPQGKTTVCLNCAGQEWKISIGPLKKTAIIHLHTPEYKEWFEKIVSYTGSQEIEWF